MHVRNPDYFSEPYIHLKPTQTYSPPLRALSLNNNMLEPSAMLLSAPGNGIASHLK